MSVTLSMLVSPDGLSITAPGQRIIDQWGNCYDLVPATDPTKAPYQVRVNGVVDPVTQRVKRLYSYARWCCQQNVDGAWWYANSTRAWVSWVDPTKHSASPEGTAVSTQTAYLWDASGSRFSLRPTSGGQVAINDVTDAATSNAVSLSIKAGVAQHTNAAQHTYAYGGKPGAWTDVTPAPIPIPPQPIPASNIYKTNGGRIYAPDGSVFVAGGPNVLDAHIGSISPQTLRTLFPKANFIRLACGIPNGFASAQPVSAIINWAGVATQQGFVVEIESHISDQRDALTGAQLDAENAWYASIAKPLVANPRIWFGSENEVGGGVSANHLATYNAVRNAGSTSPFLCCVTKGGPGTIADNPAVYPAMRNAVWDLHFYNYMTGGSTDQAAVDTYVAGYIGRAQAFAKSADGAMPCIVGEVGFINYAGGDMNVDVQGGMGTNQVVRAALTCAKSGGSGAGIWLASGVPVGWPTMTDLTVNNNALTAHGVYVNQCLAA